MGGANNWGNRTSFTDAWNWQNARVGRPFGSLYVTESFNGLSIKDIMPGTFRGWRRSDGGWYDAGDDYISWYFGKHFFIDYPGCANDGSTAPIVWHPMYAEPDTTNAMSTGIEPC